MLRERLLRIDRAALQCTDLTTALLMLSRNERGMGSYQGPDEAPLRMLEFGKDSIGPAIEDDVSVFVTQQRGFRSRGFVGVYLSKQETRIRRYHELIDEYIDGRRS